MKYLFFTLALYIPITLGLTFCQDKIKVLKTNDIDKEDPSQSLEKRVFQLLADMGSSNKCVRNSASASIKVLDKTALPFLVKALNHRNYEIRARSAVFIGNLGQKAHCATSALIRTLKDKNWQVRYASVIALGEIGPSASSSTPCVIKAFNDSHKLVRREAIWTLDKIGTAEQNSSSIIKLLEDKDSGVRTYAAVVLGRIGKKVSSVIPVLIKTLNDDNYEVREKSMEALIEIGPSSTLALMEGLKNKEKIISKNSAEILGEIGPKAAKAIPLLIKTLEDNNWEVRSSAAKALGKMGPKASIAVPKLIELLKDKDETVRGCSAKALGGIGKKSTSSIPFLIRLFEDEYSEVRESAVIAIGKIDLKGQTKVLLPALKKLLKDQNKSVRTAAKKSYRKALSYD